MFREEGDSLLLLSAEDPTLIFLCQPELLHLHLITSVIVPFCHVTVGMQQSSINQSSPSLFLINLQLLFFSTGRLQLHGLHL